MKFEKLSAPRTERTVDAGARADASGSPRK
jgi:hypothetical protein